MADEYAGTMPVREGLEVDLGPLTDFIRNNVSSFAGGLQIRQFRGGQSNPTYLVTAGSDRYVLRRKPPGKLLPSAHAVDREYRVITELQDSGVPVPRTYSLCEDETVIGTPFYLMEFVEGRVFWDQTLPELTREERTSVFEDMCRVLAALHSVDYATVGLEDYGKPGNYFARQIGRWAKQYRASETETIDAMDRLMEWLSLNLPEDNETTLVHGDYRLDNLIFHPTEPRILALVDWELSTLGHPLADLSYNAMAWRLSPEEFRGLRGVDIAALGIPTEEEYVSAYCRRTGREGIRHWDFYMAYNMFRLAAILQGIMGRVVEGTAASTHAEEMGKLARPLAELGWKQAQSFSRDSTGIQT
jgi:aminoglycoside phosphotransferase (APT) family kinase protein